MSAFGSEQNAAEQSRATSRAEHAESRTAAMPAAQKLSTQTVFVILDSGPDTVNLIRLEPIGLLCWSQSLYVTSMVPVQSTSTVLQIEREREIRHQRFS